MNNKEFDREFDNFKVKFQKKFNVSEDEIECHKEGAFILVSKEIDLISFSCYKIDWELHRQGRSIYTFKKHGKMVCNVYC